MAYFTWKEKGMTDDCETLKAMAARYKESAEILNTMEKNGFKLKKLGEKQIITHNDEKIFEEWGFISEKSPHKQLKLVLD